MSQLTIKISDKADALIAQLQKEIFNRRRKKVTAEGVVETLLESGAKSQSDKRFATSWQNLVADIERAAMVAQSHGSKPTALSDEEWALVLSHRTRGGGAPESKRAAKPRTTSTRAKATATATTPARRRSKTAAASATAPDAEVGDVLASPPAKPRATRAAKAKPARAAKASATTATQPIESAPVRSGATTRRRSSAAVASPTPEKPKAAAKATTRKPAAAKASRSSVARRMAKAASRLVNGPITAVSGAQASPPAPAPVIGSNGLDNGLTAQPTS